MNVSRVVEAAARRGVPPAVLDVDVPEARGLNARNLVLVRPDQHVAWRGDEESATLLDLSNLVRGARIMPSGKTALGSQPIGE